MSYRNYIEAIYVSVLFALTLDAHIRGVGAKAGVIEKFAGNICEFAYTLEHDITFVKAVTVTTHKFGQKGMSYPPNITCHWMFQGSKVCRPVFNCLTPINLRATIKGKGHCEDEYLKITDGIGGEERFCNNELVQNIQASQGGRDLYITYHTAYVAPDPKYTGFKCQASCLITNTHKKVAVKTLKREGYDDIKKVLDTCICGLKEKSSQNRIAGGRTADEFEFPWLAAIVGKGTREPFCGGSVINDRYVLTASHCFDDTGYEADNIEILLHAHLMKGVLQPDWGNAEFGKSGSIKVVGWDLEGKSDKDENTKRFSVERIIMHPLYNKSNIMDNDIALLKLSTKINLQGPDSITPICLPYASDTKIERTYAPTTVAGWGLSYQDAGSTNRLLQKLTHLPIINFRECESVMTRFKLTERMMCAGFKQGGRDSCEGDSGGPLMFTDTKTGQVQQLGIISWGEDCGKENSLGVYSDIQDHVHWIQYHTIEQDRSTWCSQSLIRI